MKKVIFWGTPDFALPSLQVLIKLDLVSAVVTQPDRPAGRGKKMLPSPVKLLAQENNIPILCPDRLDNDFLRDLKKYLPATHVVVAYGKIIPQSILDLSELPALNIHPSLLPELRGPSPIQTALWQGFDKTGVSLMVLDKKMDHGPILAQIPVKIEPLEAYFALSKRLSLLGGQILEDKILDYLEGKLSAKPQDDKKATFCSLIKKSDGDIHWDNPCVAIVNQVRALNPWPGTTGRINNLTVKIVSLRPTTMKLRSGQISMEGDRFFVGTADQAVEVLQCQPPGKKIMTAAEFLRGYKSKLI